MKFSIKTTTTYDYFFSKKIPILIGSFSYPEFKIEIHSQLYKSKFNINIKTHKNTHVHQVLNVELPCLPTTKTIFDYLNTRQEYFMQTKNQGKYNICTDTLNCLKSNESVLKKFLITSYGV